MSGQVARQAKDDGSAPVRKGRPSGAETKQRIIDAAADVMSRLGLANATTKEIAKASGCSEALIYKHFADKESLFIEVLRVLSPSFHDLVTHLPEAAGQRDIAEVLVDLVVRAVPFYRSGVPMFGALFADPVLLSRHREGVARQGVGPMSVNALLVTYLERERSYGRISATADLTAAAAMLIGGCFQRGFMEAFQGQELPDLPQFAESLVRTVFGGLKPA